MPVLSGKFSPAGILLTLACLPPGVWNPAANPQSQPFVALLDTGASLTCISPKVAKALGVKPIGLVPVSSASHPNLPTNTYLIDIGVVFGDLITWQSNTQVLEFQPAAGSPYEMLLGRDLICRGALTVSFDGHWTFAI
jgi:predicted aspartyl protease